MYYMKFEKSSCKLYYMPLYWIIEKRMFIRLGCRQESEMQGLAVEKASTGKTRITGLYFDNVAVSLLRVNEGIVCN